MTYPHIICPECGVVFRLVLDRVNLPAMPPESIICPLCGGAMIVSGDMDTIDLIRNVANQRHTGDKVIAAIREGETTAAARDIWFGPLPPEGKND